MNQVKRTARRRYLLDSAAAGLINPAMSRLPRKEVAFLMESQYEMSDEDIARRRALWGRTVGKIQPNRRRLTKKGFRRKAIYMRRMHRELIVQ